MSLSSGVGLISGLNYEDIINKLRQANARPIVQAQTKGQKITAKQSSLQNINKAIADFMTKAGALSQADTFLTMTATSSDATILLANADNNATAAQSSVRVRHLAQVNRIAAQGVATMDSTSIAAGVGVFQFRVGSGASTTVNLNAGMTLQQLRDAINTATGSQVRASIVNDGTPTNPYRLVLTSTQGGADNPITIMSNDTSLNLSGTTIEEAVARAGNAFNGTISASGTYTGATAKNIVIEVTSAGAVGAAKYKVSYDGGVTWTANDAFTTSATDVDVTGTAAEGVNVRFAAGAGPLNFAVGDRFTIDTFVPQLQKAQNGIIEVDGVQISRPTNTYTDAIAGVTLTAMKVSDTPASVRVQNSNNSVQTKIKDFVTAYNTLVDTVAKETAYNTTTNSGGPLFGDTGVASMLARLRNSVTAAVVGLSDYATLSAIGLTMDKQGHLQIDQTKVNDALNNNLDGVEKLFIASGTSASTSVKYVKSTADTTTGTYIVAITAAAEQAAVTGGRALESTGLAANERLTVGYNGKAAAISLTAGQNLDGVIAALNASFLTNGLAVQAGKVDGKLRISSTAYGSAETITVASDQDAAAAGQLGIGTTSQTVTGVDVAGMIGGFTAKGVGQTLTASDGSSAKGLELTITANGPMTTGFTLSHGVALNISRQLDLITDGKTGLFATRQASYDAQIKDYDKLIATLQARLDSEDQAMRKKFNALEAKLSIMQSQSAFLTAQLAALSASKTSTR